MTKVIEDAPREVLARRRRPRRRTVSLTVVGGRGVNPGIDLDDSAALLAAMERRDAIETGSEWISTDGDYARFPGLKWRRPF